MKIIIAGDFCPQHRVADFFESGNFEYTLGAVRNTISEADYAIVNFECPVTRGDEKPIEKCGQNLRCSEKGMEAISWAGFDCVTLANNHFLDYGKEGCEHTLEICKKYGIDTVGGGMNIDEASKILYKNLDGKLLAIINCCEHEFSIASETTAGSNPLYPIQQFYTIREARYNADYVLIIVHGGNEYYQYPSPRMKETYRFYIDAGADAVVNHHQHCYSGFEIYRGKPIIYGLGNFCFDTKVKKTANWYKGYFVEISFDDLIDFKLTPYLQCGNKAVVQKLSEKDMEEFRKEIEIINRIITDNGELKKKYDSYLRSCNDRISCLFEPYNNKYLRILHKLKLLPSLISKQKKITILAYLQCESHLPKVLKYLSNS